MKSDTLITVEENSMASNKPTSVAVRINTGAVDLATPNWASPDSKAAVSVEDATAQLHSNSRAAVKADPDKKENEIMVAGGSAEVQRGAEKIELAQWQKATFRRPADRSRSRTCWRLRHLVEPLNLAPIIGENPKTAPYSFRVEAGPGRGFVYLAHQHHDDVHQSGEGTAKVTPARARKSADWMREITSGT